MLIIAFLTVAFLTGAITGVLVLIVLSVRREDHRGSLPRQAPTRLAAAARALTGLRVTEPGRATHSALRDYSRQHGPARAAAGPIRRGCPLAHRHHTATGHGTFRCGIAATPTAATEDRRPT
jgi:hypothetical protein